MILLLLLIVVSSMGYKRVEIRRGSLNQLSRFVVIKGKSDLLPLIKLQDG